MDAKLLTSLFIAIMGTVMMIMMGAIGWCVKDIRSSMQRSQEKNELAIKDLRADFEQMRSDMSIKYVLREDFLRAVSNMENKMEKGFDALSKKIDALRAQGTGGE